MPVYQGGKSRIGRRIHDIINLIETELSDIKQPYFEPFVGMGGVMKHFGKDDNRNLYATDINADIIMMWKALQKGWKPPRKCSLNKYNKLKKSKSHSSERGFIGVVASWAGIFFQNYRLHYNKDKDYLGEGYRSLMKILPDIKKVNFLSASSYDEWNVNDHLIYCDPPYKNNNLSNKLFTNFDSKKFWEDMRKWSEDNIVIISESTAPQDFKKIWCNESFTSNRYKTKKYNDCLFLHENIFNKISKTVLNDIKNL